MRRVAVISDVHGNVPALEAALREIEALDVDLVVFAGDVGHGPEPEPCVERLRALGDRIRLVRGNCDREEGLIPDAAATVPLDIEGLGSVLVCHATPRSDTETVTYLTPEDEVAATLAGVDADVVVCGHTHSQYDRQVGSTRLVCAGSVGMPYEAEGGAYWVLLGPGVEHRRTEYDLEAAAARIRAAGWDEFAAENVLTRPTADEAQTFFESQRR
jgi:putative phosphoesterase